MENNEIMNNNEEVIETTTEELSLIHIYLDE